jgi:tetratricopeptide (TPR) repeat protein
MSDLEASKFHLLLELERVQDARALVDSKNLETADAWDDILQGCMAARMWGLAAEYTQRSLALDPQHFQALRAQAVTKLETGLVEEGTQALDEWLAVLRGAQGRLDEALQLAERAVLLAGWCPFAWAVRGNIYFLKGEWELARLDLETAWRRADADGRRRAQSYWWILASLQHKPLAAFIHGRKARDEVLVEWHEERLGQIRAHLRKTAGERWRQHPVLVAKDRGVRWLLRLVPPRRHVAAPQAPESQPVEEASQVANQDTA